MDPWKIVVTVAAGLIGAVGLGLAVRSGGGGLDEWQLDASLPNRSKSAPQVVGASTERGDALPASDPVRNIPRRQSPVGVAEVSPKPSGVYDQVEDLFAYATLAADSTERGTIINGWYAVQDCRAVKTDRDRLTERSSYGGTDAQDIRVAAAARQVLRRCKGFFDNDVSAIMGLRERLRVQLNAIDADAYLASGLSGPISDAQFLRVIESGDGLTFSSALVDIRPQLVSRLRYLEGSADAAIVGVALLVAQCDLARSCNRSSLNHQINCALSGHCEDPQVDLYAGLTPDSKAKVVEMAAAIVAAFRARDARFFGFPRQPRR